MAVHKRTYRTYAGALTPAWSRFLVITRFTFADLFQMRGFIAGLVVALVPVVGFGAYIYIMNSATARALLELPLDAGSELLNISNSFFLRLMMTQAWLSFMLTAWIAPALVTPDLTHNALPLYLSRPLSRAEYVLGKAGVLLALVTVLLLLPGLLLLGLQSQMAGWDFFRANYWMAGSMLAGSLLWMAVLALLALAVSATVKWRIAASAAMFALFFVPAGIGQAFNETLNTHWGYLLNFPLMINVVWHDLFSVPLTFRARGQSVDFPVAAAWAVLLAICGLSLALLQMRLKAREVVRS
jgi:ABC-2 type transport system permease protein